MMKAERILCCADCGSDLNDGLVCGECGRAYAAEADGIISALPRAMNTAAPSKERIKATLDGDTGGADRNHTVVEYERAFHDDQASYYDTLFGDPLPLGRYYRRLVGRQIFGYVRGKPFVVDLCCGTGKSSLPLARMGCSVVGVDVSREMLRAYQRKCDKEGLRNVLLIHADASRPPLRKQSCGAIIMIGGLHHIPDQSGCVRHCCDLLTDDGVLIFHEPLQSGHTSLLSRLAENIYAVTNPMRMGRALLRRLGLASPAAPTPPAEAAETFTPFERPFTSAGQMLELIPPGSVPSLVRSQGLFSFREFEPTLQNALGVPIADAVVALDFWFSGILKETWSGDALFALIRKQPGQRP